VFLAMINFIGIFLCAMATPTAGIAKVFGLLTFGESWHNNHHAFESSAAIGLKWWQVDFGYAVVWILAKLGLVWDVNLPTAKMMAAKKITIAQD
ncbi:MAG: hypothetical protein V7L26_02400, partial [Nostoc sp.]